MYIEKIKSKSGKFSFSFSYIDKKTGKRVRLKRSQHPKFDNERDARRWAKSQKAFDQARKDEIERITAWRKMFYQFEELVKRFAEHKQHVAPNSWGAVVGRLEQHVLPWFLGLKKQNNINAWKYMFEDFRDYLRKHDKQVGKDEKLSVSSQNQTITALNSFLEFLAQRGDIDPTTIAIKCKLFPKHMLKVKDITSVIPHEEYLIIKEQLYREY